MTKEERQAEYLRIVEGTGSPVQARRRLGLTSKTVANWRLDPGFVERLQDAIEIARDAVIQKSREMALAGSDTQLSLWMKLAHAELRPIGAQVAVGVKVDARQAELELSPDQAVERLNRIMRTARARALASPGAAGGAIDVEAVPVPAPDGTSLTGPENGLPDDIEDLL